MVRLRKLVLAITVATAMSSGMAHALGLGEVSLQSALNQPLSADIELRDIGDLQPSEILAALASPDEFSKVGVERDFFLTDLRFTPIIKPNGKSVIHVSSTKPVREPYLDFLVEVTWPGGRLLREYTLLLDPPLYSPQAAAAAPQLPVAATGAPPARGADPAFAAAPAALPQSAAAPGPSAAASGTAPEYRTSANDTLWGIAERHRVAGSVDQAMLAIQDLNPHAFFDGNINRLKAGEVLRMPTEQQILRRSRPQAVAEVAAQNAAWRAAREGGSAARQLDAAVRTAPDETPAAAPAGDNLRLVSPGSGSSASSSEAGADGAAGVKALSDKLAVTQESLDASRRESDELRSRVSDLQAQLDKLQRLIQLKDDQLAKLQAQLGTQGAPAEGSAAPSPAAGQPTAGGTPNALATPAAAPSGDTALPVAAGQPAPAAPVAAAKPEPAKPAATPGRPAAVPEAESGPLDAMLGMPLLLGAIGSGVLLLLLIALMVSSRRRAARDAELQEAPEGEPEGLPDDAAPGGEFEGAAATPPLDERVAAQASDALGQADMYIAYGRFNQAAERLLAAIDEEPQRTDLRLKLMEVYAELGDREGFVRQEQELREMGAAAAEVEQLKRRYPGMAAASLAAVAGQAPQHRQQDDDFSLDELPFEEPAPSAERSRANEFDLDFEGLLDDLDDQHSQRSSLDEAAHAADLELSGLDDEPGRRVARVGLPQAGESADELAADLADFDLELDRPLPAEQAAAADAGAFPAAEREAPTPASDAPARSAPAADVELPGKPQPPQPGVAEDFAAQLQRASAQAQEGAPSAGAEAPLAGDAQPREEDFDFLSGTDETATKLDLAHAYLDMGDRDGARDILDEVLAEGDDAQRREARELLAKLG